MGSAPYPLSAASAAGSTLGLAEQGKAQRNQTCADEYRQHGIAGHDVPDILDQRGQCGGVTQNSGDSHSGSSFGSALLS